MAFQPRFWMLAALIGAGCTSATNDGPTSTPEPQTQRQSLGEATQAYWFEGAGAGVMPAYDERVAWNVINQIRMNTDVFDVRDDNDQLVPPSPPMTLQPGMAEVGRWQGAHGLENSCFCAPNMMGDPVEAGAGASPFSCCTAGYDRGTIECVGPVVACGEEGLMPAADRWGLLKRGPGQITQEIFYTTADQAQASGAAAANWLLTNALGAALSPGDNTGAVARVGIPIVPEECKPPEDTCESGDCVGPSGEATCDPSSPDAPNECIGTCDSGPKAGEFCTIPEPLDPATCNPDEYPRGYWWSFIFGQTSEPTPFLNDVVHMNLAEGLVSVVTNYFDPVGEPQLLQIATSSACNDLERTFMRPGDGMGGDADAGGDAGAGSGLPYAGNTYQWDVPTSTTGCVRYIAYALDAEGFTHTFPTYGSLGMNLGAGGAILPNDDSCPIWVADERPEPACLPDADECAEGSTRLCYTGRPGTEDKGICDVGTETCRNGRWAGICEGETTPEVTDVCGDEEDDNCNGFVDETCPVQVDPTPDAGDSASPDAGAGEPDMGEGPIGGGTSGGSGGDEGSGCCATANGSGANLNPLALILVGALLVRRRRRS